jgi:hypothetical protein
MGVNYEQIAVLGIEVKAKDCKVITSPAVYEKQNRYNSKTGKVSHQETVLVKEEEYKYSFGGFEFEDFWDLGNDADFRDMFIDPNLEMVYVCDDYSDGRYLIGYKIGDDADCGRATLLDGEISVAELVEKQLKLEEIFSSNKDRIKLHFTTQVG